MYMLPRMMASIIDQIIGLPGETQERGNGSTPTLFVGELGDKFREYYFYENMSIIVTQPLSSAYINLTASNDVNELTVRVPVNNVSTIIGSVSKDGTGKSITGYASLIMIAIALSLLVYIAVRARLSTAKQIWNDSPWMEAPLAKHKCEITP
jgi:hypothetical protein